MAHTVIIGSLVEELVKTLTKTSSEASVEQYKRTALRTFADARPGQTNQFDVNTQLQGLEEKASILNNDPLADALHLRLGELSSQSGKWTPEILSLLLKLSDRPVHNTKVDDLINLKPNSPPAPLTWSDIIAEDPLDNQDGTWDDVDFGGNTSEEDEVSKTDRSEESDLMSDSSLIESEGVGANVKDLLQPRDYSGFHEIKEAQFWKPRAVTNLTQRFELDNDKHPKLLLTELQTIREVLFMLLGLPTSIFVLNDNENFEVVPGFEMRLIPQDSIIVLLQDLAEIGDKLRVVSGWIERKTAVPVEQTFQAAIESRLGKLHRSLDVVQTKFLDPHLQSMSSLLQLYDEVCSYSRPIQQIHAIIMDLKLRSEPEIAFGILECLFEKACANQSIEYTDGYEYMARLFFECFQTYLRPIRSWMERGQLSKHDHVMFIGKNEEEVPLGSLWQAQHHLILNGDGKLHAPNFLHVAAKKIFNAGKSVDFLIHLDSEEGNSGGLPLDNAGMSFDDVCQPADLGMLSPFPELFDMAFDTWTASKHRFSSSMLRRQLETECGLQRCLDALEHIYFFQNSALSTNIARKIFERLDSGKRRWNDNFVLTELFQETFNAIPYIDLNSLEVRSNRKGELANPQRARRSMAALADLRICYALPWPIANIVKTESLQVYQRVFVLLMQLQRAKHLLQIQKFPRNGSPTLEKPVSILYSLHHRLLWFTNTILTYVADMVLSATTIDMHSRMSRAEDVDSMIAVHEVYVSQLQDRCFLSKQHGPIHQAIISILDLTVLFKYMQASYVTQRSEGLVNCRRGRQRQRQLADRDSDDEEDEEDEEAEGADAGYHSLSTSERPDVDRLRSICDTFEKLHGYVTAAVQGVSKADSSACWEVLASGLAVGLSK